jgi:hypothetical protein
MKNHLRRRSRLMFLVCAFLLGVTACSFNAWSTIIATAQAIAQLSTVVYPRLTAFSNEAVQLLQTAQAAVQAYKANPTENTVTDLREALQAIETRLPADLNLLNLPVADQQKVSAAVNIILDFVESLAVQQPAVATVVKNARINRAVAPAVPLSMSKKEIQLRWNRDVCAGDSHCTSLVK